MDKGWSRLSKFEISSLSSKAGLMLTTAEGVAHLVITTVKIQKKTGDAHIVSSDSYPRTPIETLDPTALRIRALQSPLIFRLDSLIEGSRER